MDPHLPAAHCENSSWTDVMIRERDEDLVSDEIEVLGCREWGHYALSTLTNFSFSITRVTAALSAFDNP